MTVQSYNVAVDCQTLRQDPASTAALLLLRAHDRAMLATIMRERDTAWLGACSVVDFLVQRSDSADIDSIIRDAQIARDAAYDRRAETAAEVAALADEIEAAHPDARSADVGIA